MEKNEKINLNKPEYFFNRELSWLKFNLRVLREAGVKTTPLLERLKFVAITASNLDEFFMVRVAGLWDQYENGINKRDAAGLTVKAQLEEISKAAHDQMKLLNKYLLSLVKELREAGIYICRVSELSEKGRRWLEAYYQEEIFPVLTPMAVDASRKRSFTILFFLTSNQDCCTCYCQYCHTCDWGNVPCFCCVRFCCCAFLSSLSSIVIRWCFCSFYCY